MNSILNLPKIKADLNDTIRQEAQVSGRIDPGFNASEILQLVVCIEELESVVRKIATPRLFACDCVEAEDFGHDVDCEYGEFWYMASAAKMRQAEDALKSLSTQVSLKLDSESIQNKTAEINSRFGFDEPKTESVKEGL